MMGLTWFEIAQAAAMAIFLAIGGMNGYVRSGIAIMLFSSIFAFAPPPTPANLANIILGFIGVTVLLIGMIQHFREPSR